MMCREHCFTQYPAFKSHSVFDMKIASLLIPLCLVIVGCGPSKPPGTENTKPPVAEKSKPPAAEKATVVAWGSNRDGQTTIPVGLVGVTAIAAGENFTVALQSNGAVNAWGKNEKVPDGLSGVKAIAAGFAHTVALKSDGTVVTWGWGAADEEPDGLNGVTAIAAGSLHTVALKRDGTVVAWGDDRNGQITGTPTKRSAVANPVTLNGVVLRGVTAIAAGGYHTVALQSNGTVIAWGSNGNGQTNVPTGLSGVTAIAAGGQHTVALKSDGTVVAWGLDEFGQATVPVGLSGVTAIAAGGLLSLALKSDGTMAAWGNNRDGQITGTPTTVYPYSATGNPVTLNGIVLSGVRAIAAGDFHTVAVSVKGHTIILTNSPSISTSSEPERPRAILGDKRGAEKWLRSRIESSTEGKVKAVFWFATTQSPPLMTFNGEMYSPRHKGDVSFSGYLTVRDGEWDMVDFKIGR